MAKLTIFNKISFLLIATLALSKAYAMPEPPLQEQLNNDAMQTDPNNAVSRFALGLPITIDLINNQINNFNERMRAQKIFAKFSRNHTDDVLITFFARLPNSQRAVLLHKTIMLHNKNLQVNNAAVRVQLRRRFENKIEDHVGKLRNALEDAAVIQFKNSWKTKLYFKIAPKVVDQVSDKIGYDLAKDIINLIPFSLREKLNEIKNADDLIALIKDTKRSEELFDDSMRLSEELEQVKKILKSIPDTEKAKKDTIKTEVQKEFCSVFEQQLAR